MTVFDQMYNELMADLRAKGFGGIVDQINNHDYKNDCQHNAQKRRPQVKAKNTTSNKNKNERPADIHGGLSLLNEVIS